MNIYTEKGLVRWINCCVGMFALFIVTMAVLALRATLGW